MTCEYCSRGKKELAQEILYEDEYLLAVLHPSPAIKGHTVLFPKQHSTTLAQLPPQLFQHMLTVGNVLSSKLFQTLGAEGTNLLLTEGTLHHHQHLLLEILPRNQNDGISLEWNPLTVSEKDNEAVLKGLLQPAKEEIKKAGHSTTSDSHSKPSPHTKTPQQPNYITRQLRRMP